MTPTLPTQDDPWRATEGEAFDVLAAMPDACVDVTICDPPYTKRVHDHAKSVSFARGKPRVAYAEMGFAPLESFDFVGELLRVTRRWVLCFTALESFGDYQRAATEKRYVRSAIYRRKNSTPQLSGDRPGQACEGIAVMHRPGRKRWNGRGKHGFYEASRDRGPRLHPAQKPLALMRELVRLYSEPNDIVFDPFMGSGTTGLACAHEGRLFLGIDNQFAYVERAATRLGDFRLQTRTNEARP